MTTRRQLIAAAPALAFAAPALAQTAGVAQVPPIGAGDVPIGRADAPVQVIEYASFACPHCAHWMAETWPAFKRRYVDTGLVRFAMRELLTAPADMAAAGAMLARCAPPGRYYDLAGAIFGAQGRLAAAEQPMTVLAQAGAQVGLSTTAVSNCLRSRANLDALQRRIQQSVDAGITGTPVFFVNGRRLPDTPEHGLDVLSAAIDPTLTTAQRGRLPR